MFPTELIYIVVVLIVAGLLLWGITQIPLDPVIARIIRVVIIIGVCIYVIYALIGFLPAGGHVIRR